MYVLLSFLKWGSIGYSLGIVQWDFTRRDYPRNPGRVSGSGPVKSKADSTTICPPKLEQNNSLNEIEHEKQRGKERTPLK